MTSAQEPLQTRSYRLNLHWMWAIVYLLSEEYFFRINCKKSIVKDIIMIVLKKKFNFSVADEILNSSRVFDFVCTGFQDFAIIEVY